jgi:hypothetical protein
MYLGNTLAFVGHYALLNHWTAVAINGIMAIQTLAAIWIVQRPGLRWIYYALTPGLAVISVVTWEGSASLFAVAAGTFSTLGRLQSDETTLRLLLLASTPCWAAHDFVVASLPGFIADTLSMLIGTTMLLRRCPAISVAMLAVVAPRRRGSKPCHHERVVPPPIHHSKGPLIDVLPRTQPPMVHPAQTSTLARDERSAPSPSLPSS